MENRITHEALEKLVPRFDERGYALVCIPNGDCYCAWTTKSDRVIPRDWSDIFELSVPPIQYWSGNLYPQFNFLYYRKFNPDEIKDAYEEASQAFSSKTSLILVRDALEKQLERDLKRLEEPFTQIESILKFTVVETEPHLPFRTFLNPLSGKEIDVTQSGYHSAVRALWDLICLGGELARVGYLIDELLEEYRTPTRLAKMQKDGLLYYVNQRDEILVSSVRLHSRWWVYEAFVYTVLLDQPAPGWEAVIERLDEEKKAKRSSGSYAHGPTERRAIIAYLVLEKRIEIDNSIKLKAELQSIIPELRNSTDPLKAVKRFLDYRPGKGRGSFLDFRTRLADKIQELANIYGPEFMNHEIKRVDRHYMTTDMTKRTAKDNKGQLTTNPWR